MTQEIIRYIGLDVAKSKLDFYEEMLGGMSFSNSSTGIKKVIAACQKISNPFVVCEATSHYHISVTKALQEAGIRVSVVNPRYVRSFARAKGHLEKTDAIDAKIIASFGSSIAPQPTKTITEDRLELKSLQTRARQLTQMVVMEKTHREGLATEEMQDQASEHLKYIEKQLETVEVKMDVLIAKDPDLHAIKTRLLTVPGIGVKTMRLLISELPELGHLTNKALSKLVGVAPLNNDSGGSRGKRSIHGGRKSIRNGLYMAALAAKKYNPMIRSLYDRLILRGKLPKVALVACMRKLLMILNSMVKNGTDFATSPSLPLQASAFQGCLSLEGRDEIRRYAS
jgi:transposase